MQTMMKVEQVLLSTSLLAIGLFYLPVSAVAVAVAVRIVVALSLTEARVNEMQHLHQGSQTDSS